MGHEATILYWLPYLATPNWVPGITPFTEGSCLAVEMTKQSTCIPYKMDIRETGGPRRDDRRGSCYCAAQGLGPASWPQHKCELRQCALGTIEPQDPVPTEENCSQDEPAPQVGGTGQHQMDTLGVQQMI